MKIGLLECDHVSEAFRSIGGDYGDMFRALLPDLEFVTYDVCRGKFPASLSECEGYLATGSKLSVYDGEDWIVELKAFVRAIYQSENKFVGVCFGHQMLGEALGGKVEKAATGWSVGVHVFDVLVKEPWMEPFQPTVNLLMMCQDQVVKLPEKSTVLATAPGCPVGMFRVGENMLGLQAHPEFPVTYEKALLTARLERIGHQKVNAALKTLEFSLHEKLAAKWITNFFEK